MIDFNFVRLVEILDEINTECENSWNDEGLAYRIQILVQEANDVIGVAEEYEE